MPKIDFARLRADLQHRLPDIVRLLLPDGRLVGRAWVTLNPTRHDRHAGSFRINIQTGCWADFATGDRGGDVISLAAYLQGCSQIDAARGLIQMAGLRHA